MISKSASITENFRQNIKITNSAREGWGLILQTLNPDDVILLPSYIGVSDREGSGIYDPVMETGVKHDFYLLTNDLSVSISNIENKIKSKKYSLILLVHYFGFKIQNIEAIIKLCKINNVIVVEDCAHLYNYNLFNLSDAGTFGDFAFYSFHKNFPIQNGGLFVQNNSNVLSPDTSNVRVEFDFAEVLLAYQTESIAKKRIENFKFLDTIISKINGVEPLKKFRTGDIPHDYPIVVKDNLREKIYFWLIDRDMTLIALYYRLIEPLKSDEFKQMHYLSNNILNLPIHQDIEKNELRALVRLIEEALIELNE